MLSELGCLLSDIALNKEQAPHSLTLMILSSQVIKHLQAHNQAQRSTKDSTKTNELYGSVSCVIPAYFYKQTHFFNLLLNLTCNHKAEPNHLSNIIINTFAGCYNFWLTFSYSRCALFHYFLIPVWGVQYFTISIFPDPKHKVLHTCLTTFFSHMPHSNNLYM